MMPDNPVKFSKEAYTPRIDLPLEVFIGKFDEAQYEEAHRLISIAAGLFGDGQGRELGDNAEYERGMCELICERLGLPIEMKKALCEKIHIEALSIGPGDTTHRVLQEAEGLLRAMDDYFRTRLLPDGPMHIAHGRLGSALKRLKEG